MASSTFEHRLRATWQQRGALACALWPLSRLFAWLAAMDQRRQQRYAVRLPVPVVVVGNVVAGGAGKTPTTLAVVRHLQAQGWQPGIVSRGYGRAPREGERADAPQAVTPTSDPHAVGDEPLLLRQRADVPVFVCAQRADAGRALLAAHPDTDILVCDDGLQHLRLARDAEIAVFDQRGTGNGWRLPAGPLRDAWPRPVDLVLRTEAGPTLALPPGAQAFDATRTLARHALRSDGAHAPLHTLQGARLVALAGIARPEAFFDMLRAAGLPLHETLALPDHYDFKSWSRPPDLHETLICTEKDAVKLWRLRPDALAVPLVLDVPPAFFSALDGLLAARGYHPRHNASAPS
jgi:tetraacyldisaccharide 4'-kinase